MSIPFIRRHIGPRPHEYGAMLKSIGATSLDEFIGKVVPASIRSKDPLTLKAFPKSHSESEAITRIRAAASKNKVYRSYIGMGYFGTIVPPVIQRNILENPSWYTAYTPYQPEISQGRLEALLNYQTVVTDLTGLDIANASLLDEATAAAEAMGLSVAHYRSNNGEDGEVSFFISNRCNPQTIDVIANRAEAIGVKIIVGEWKNTLLPQNLAGAIVAYPDTTGHIDDFKPFAQRVHEKKAIVTVITDLLALTVLTPPGEFDADIAVGNSQRFGVPFGFGGPHAAFFAVRDDLKRLMPGRLIGLSRDSQGNPALRLALQTREQHIRREKATSNICTAQVLLAVMAGMYAVYHGPEGLKEIALSVYDKAQRLGDALTKAGLAVVSNAFFDTIHISGVKTNLTQIQERAESQEINLRVLSADEITVSIDETTTESDLKDILFVLTGANGALGSPQEKDLSTWSPSLVRRSNYLAHEVFNRYRSETEFLRYVKRLENKDLSLANAMIPLGSCTMKLNATSEMLPVTWREFGEMHPFVPAEQAKGYAEICSDLETALSEITGFAGVSLQPNAGSQGEYAGLLVIRAYHRSKGEGNRTVCLIPKSAHGTNPASAAMVGMDVVVVDCDQKGNVDLVDLKAKAEQYRDTLAALMVTYPSTHGVFESRIKEICAIAHANGGQVYMDGANLNAQVGLCKPGDIGADVCHINLHKTFCIPHGGGGPGMGPIGVAAHLVPFLPDHAVVKQGRAKGIGAVSAAPWGSASILPISWMYIAMMGGSGLTEATKLAILNANYVAARLDAHYPVLYKGENGYVAHECILDLRPLKKGSGVEAEDVAKRLMDYGFHAPTLSFPVVGTLMIEPTESESKEELDRFCDAMIQIRAEIQEIEDGKIDPKNNPLKNAPHTQTSVITGEWNRPYSRERAAFPTPFTKAAKFWPSVGRLDGVYGDRNLVCTCPPLEAYEGKVQNG